MDIDVAANAINSILENNFITIEASSNFDIRVLNIKELIARRIEPGLFGNTKTITEKMDSISNGAKIAGGLAIIGTALLSTVAAGCFGVVAASGMVINSLRKRGTFMKNKPFLVVRVNGITVYDYQEDGNLNDYSIADRAYMQFIKPTYF
ncbi:hypothetical protein WA158_001614 [Blastocystis sp. Blastoise]